MKIRRYVGKDTQEALLKVKMDLGNDALILNTKKFRKKGIAGLFSKQMVEILAAVDDINTGMYEADKRINENKKYSGQKAEMPLNNIPPNNVPLNKMPLNKMTLNNMNIKNQRENIDMEEKEDGRIIELENKVKYVEGMLNKIYDEITNENKSNYMQASERNSGNQIFDNILQLFYDNLINNEVEPENAKRIIEKAQNELKGNISVNDALKILYCTLMGILGEPEPVNLREDGKPTVVFFVGPTGVGKTTTMAKIAASYWLNDRKNIGLITADTYRIAAVEQLKTYTDILGLPLKVIYSPSELKDAIDQYSDKDLIMIDTAGRSHRNEKQFDELKELVSSYDADEIFLLLNSGTSWKNCMDILDSYSFLKDYKLIFTKLDENPRFGIILNTIMYNSKGGLSYITIGQSVPDDIEIVDVSKVAKKLLGSIS